ncbi:MAG: metallophosphoesterase [Myxococcota bacterium]
MSGPKAFVIGDVHGCFDELEALVHNVDREVILVGDLVAKGPASAKVVAWARERSIRAVRGNHDEHVLRFRRSGTLPKKETHRQVCRELEEADWRYLESLPLLLELPALNAVVVHGGLVPGVPLATQDPKHLMNLRSIRADGTPSTRIEGEPWASLYEGPALAVFGHDAVRGLQTHRFAIGLDTGCVYGGKLTGVMLPERTLRSVDAQAMYVPPT